MTRLFWTDRRWAFDLPAAAHPSLIERLRGTPARVEELTRGLEPDTLTRHDGDSWSIQENVGHLLDLEFLPNVRLDELLSGVETMTPADMSNQRTHEARHDEAELGELLAAFRRERTQLVARLESLRPEDFERSAQHPRLERPMRVVDMCQFHADHDDHHLARIRELTRRFAGR